MANTKHISTNQSVLISAPDLKSKLDSDMPVTFVDVRNPNPWELSEIKIKGAVRIGPKELPINSSWPKDQLLAFY